VTVTVHPGQMLAVTGPSGAGKTTLLAAMAGLLPPATGRILVDGGELRDRDRGVRLGVVLIPQENGLAAILTAAENIAVAMIATGGSPADARRGTAESLERVGLAGQADQLIDELSGGQQQRAAIARALVHEPPLVVADEPTAHLDYMQVEDVLILIRDLAAPGRLVVVATHDDRFSPLADRVVELVPRKDEPEPEVRRVLLEAGEIVFEQGEVSDLVYVVEEGLVEIFRRRADGGEEVMVEHGPGAYFGEIGPLLRLPRTASARATMPSRLTGLGPREFRRWTGDEGAGPRSPSRY
jgi:putative ABC transport system ATP-binding protein